MTDCGHCQRHLIAYIDNDLPTRTKRHVADHLRTCERCYTLYVQQRDQNAQLVRDLSILGSNHTPDFDGMWATIDSQLTIAPSSHRSDFSWQRGLVGLAFAVMCVLPWTLSLDGFVASAALPVGATPAEMPHETPEGTITTRTSLTVAYDFERATEDAQPPTPTSTPAVAPAPDNLP
jgi:anti-sigma factor RsiW